MNGFGSDDAGGFGLWVGVISRWRWNADKPKLIK
jgi:hypothetical protein